MHNELTPFLDEVKLASLLFLGSTLFVSIPFGITNINVRKKCAKVCTKKNYTHILSPSQDPNPRTSKMLKFCVLAPKLTQRLSCIVICAIIVGVIKNNFFMSNFKPLAQACTFSYNYIFDIQLLYYIWAITYLRGAVRN